MIEPFTQEELYTDGITYWVLRRDVENPEADRRKKDVFHQPIIPKGTRLRLRTWDWELGGETVKSSEFSLAPGSKSHWTDSYERIGRGQHLFTCLSDAADEVPATTYEWVMDQFPLLKDNGANFVAYLLDHGGLSPKTLRAQYDVWENE